MLCNIEIQFSAEGRKNNYYNCTFVSLEGRKMSDFGVIQPESIWKWFSILCKIPRPSGHEAGVINMIRNYAEKNGFRTRSDQAGNLVVYKDASRGYSGYPTVILQAHVDMVCEKNQGIDHDFHKDPIEPYVVDGWVKARGTTLGADNGIGVSAMLAILEDNQLQHGPLELLFTIDEERGLTGARNLDKTLLSGKILINLDSEDEDELFIGCAGGIDTIAEFDPSYDSVPDGYCSYNIILSGLTGGHSGDEIDKGHANSVKLIARLLYELEKTFNLRISSVVGGHQHNAIPREAMAKVCIPCGEKNKFVEEITKWKDIFIKEYKDTDPNMNLSWQEAENFQFVFLNEFQEKVIHALNACPHGVQRMSRSMPGLVETSTNLASVKEIKNKIVIATSQRSSVDSAKYDIAGQVRSVFHLAGARTEHSTGYPGWEPQPDSLLVRHVSATYLRLFGKEPVVRAIHAGLECGLFLEKYPELDMISFGPTIKGVHSPDERVNINSVKKFWDLLLDVLKTLPAR